MPEHDLPIALPRPARDIVLETDPHATEASVRETPGRLEASCSRPRVLRRHVRILFISAHSSGGHQLALNEEYRRIERRLESDPCGLLGSSCERIDAEKFARDVGFRCAKDMEAKE
jgi:hypothetical protein